MKAALIGSPVDRVDGFLKVTGCATYTAEFAIPGLVNAVIAGSTIARGRITNVDTTAAARAPGVLAIYTHLNAPRLPAEKANEQGSGSPADRRVMIFQDDTVHYSGQPVALAVAETLEQATEAANLIRFDYQEETPVLALAGGKPYAPKKGGGAQAPTTSKRGDVAAGMLQARAIVDQTYSTPMENHNPIEPHATIAIWEAPDRLTLYDATQGVHVTKKRLAKLFALPPENVRVISYFIGGGFGTKGPVWSHEVLAALAAKQLGRPVKLALSRRQMFNNTGFRSRTEQKITLGATAAGKLTAIKHDVLAQTSDYEEFVETSALITRMLYSCPNVVTSHQLVRLHYGTPSFMRAPGEASGSFALEMAMDELAEQLKMDPIELRIRNYADRDEQENLPFSSKSLSKCYRIGAEQFGWAKRRPEPGSMQDGRWLIGQGMATASYPVRRSKSSALARILKDGSAIVQAGTQDIGTGTYTIMTQIAAQTLGLPEAKVKFELGDTLYPETPVSGGSQTAASTGSAVEAASLAVIKKLVDLAVADPGSPLHGANPSAVVVDGGRLLLKIDSSKADKFGDLIARANASFVEAKAESGPSADGKKYAKHSFGAQFCEVRVDRELGEIRVSRWVGAFAAGRILNAKTARSQLMGGILFGIGMALTEQTVPDLNTGGIVNANLAEYHIPVNADIPMIHVAFVEEVDSHVNPLGVKGVGELGITGAAAAVANAIHHATGKRLRDLPITPDKLV